MPNKGWMTKEVVRSRLERAMHGYSTYIDERDWRALVKEAQHIGKDGYTRGFTAGKKRKEKKITVKVYQIKGQRLA